MKRISAKNYSRAITKIASPLIQKHSRNLSPDWAQRCVNVLTLLKDTPAGNKIACDLLDHLMTHSERIDKKRKPMSQEITPDSDEDDCLQPFFMHDHVRQALLDYLGPDGLGDSGSYKAAGVFGSSYTASAIQPEAVNEWFLQTVAPTVVYGVPIPDLNMTQSFSKAVTGTLTLTTPASGDVLAVFNPYSDDQNDWLRLYAKTAAGARFNYLQSLTWSQQLSDSYTAMRHSASFFRAKCTTYDAGSTNVAGVMYGVATQSPINVRLLTVSSVQSLNASRNGKRLNVSIKDGMIFPTTPFGSYEFLTPAAESTQVQANTTVFKNTSNTAAATNSRATQTGAAGPFTYTAGLTPTVFDSDLFTDQLADIMPLGYYGDFSVNYCIPITYAAGVTSMRAELGVTRATASAAYAEVLTETLVPDLQPLVTNLVAGGGTQTMTGNIRVAGTSLRGEITRLRIIVTAIGGNLTQFVYTPTLPAAIDVVTTEEYNGLRNPSSILLIAGMPSGIATTFDSTWHGEVVPDETLLKDVKINSNIENPFSMELTEAGWAGCEALGFGPVMSNNEYEHFLKSGLQRVAMNRNLSYHAAGLGDFLRGIWKVAKPVVGAFRPVIDTLVRSGAASLGTMATENPMLGGVIADTTSKVADNILDDILGPGPGAMYDGGRNYRSCGDHTGYTASGKGAKRPRQGLDPFQAPQYDDPPAPQQPAQRYAGDDEGLKRALDLSASERNRDSIKSDLAKHEADDKASGYENAAALYNMGQPTSLTRGPGYAIFPLIHDDPRRVAIASKIIASAQPLNLPGRPNLSYGDINTGQINGAGESIWLRLDRILVNDPEAMESIKGAVLVFLSLRPDEREKLSDIYLTLATEQPFTGPSVGLGAYCAMSKIPAVCMVTGSMTGGQLDPVAKIPQKLKAAYDLGYPIILVASEAEAANLIPRVRAKGMNVAAGIDFQTNRFTIPGTITVGYFVANFTELNLAVRASTASGENRKTLMSKSVAAARVQPPPKTVPVVNALGTKVTLYVKPFTQVNPMTRQQETHREGIHSFTFSQVTPTLLRNLHDGYSQQQRTTLRDFVASLWKAYDSNPKATVSEKRAPGLSEQVTSWLRSIEKQAKKASVVRPSNYANPFDDMTVDSSPMEGTFDDVFG